MFSWTGLRQQKKDNTSRSGQPQAETQTVEYDVDKVIETQFRRADCKNWFFTLEKGAKRIKVDCREIRSVAVLADGEHVVGGGQEGKIRKWRIRDGTEVGMPMDAGSGILDLAASRDGQWIVSGTKSGTVTVWNAASGEKKTEFRGYRIGVQVGAVDISFDGTKIATGSDDHTARVWSCSAGNRLLQNLKHDSYVAAVKFSPDGRFLATDSAGESVRVYNSQNATLVFSAPIKVYPFYNRSLAWSVDGKQLFALSKDGHIHRLNSSNGTTLSKWPIHSSEDARCIALEKSGTFVAASVGPSVSLWSTTTGQQIGSVIQYSHSIWSMAISHMNDIVICGENSVTVTISCVTPLQPDRKTSLRKTVLVLRDEPADSELTPKQQKGNPGALMNSLGAEAHETSPDELVTNLDEHAPQYFLRLPDTQGAVDQEEDSFFTHKLISGKRMASLEQTNQDLHIQLENSRNKTKFLEQTNQGLRVRLAKSQENFQNRIASLEQTIQGLRVQLTRAQEKADLSIRINCAQEQRLECESLYSQRRIYDAARSLLKLDDTLSDDARANMSGTDWLQEFAHRCVTALERVGDEASDDDRQDEAVSAYSTALSLRFSTPILIKWARKMLVRGPGKEALNTASNFKVPRFTVYRTICGILEDNGRLTEAVECFQQAQDELEDEATHSECTQWELDVRVRLAGKLEKLGDIAKDAEKHDEAIGHYSTALKLNPKNFDDILLKKSNEVIELDPLSYIGYEGKHAALHRMMRYSEAFEAFELMLSMLDRSSDPGLSERRRQYVDATSAILEVVEETIHEMPRVLIDTITGDLYDKTRQAAAFKELPIYNELRSSMTTQLDHPRIWREVKEFYRYVMLSHRWQPHEPTFQTVENLSVYKLPTSPAFSKLKNFCILVRTLGFKWAWSDTCCVNQLDKTVQQESLVAMFRWYRGSSLTVVHLLGVFSKSQVKGTLWQSIWNTRGWTYQEYLASEVVQFYTEDWKPYLELQMFNHKESPVILLEMEQAMNFKTKELISLQPGFDRAREKLFLASKRQTTREEDRAYSLFGIFNVALPVIHGEGNQAIGRLLEHILPRSDNVTLLAWTGRTGSHHSYLPSDLSVYDQIVPPHILAPVETANMEGLVNTLRRSISNLSQPMAMYEQCYNLPPLLLISGRLRLSGIVFPLADLVRLRGESDLATYRGTSPMLGDVDIQTRDDLSGLKGFLIHPWISPLLDLDFSRGEPLFDNVTRALRLVVRLKQPFGALLLTPVSRAQYRRVATDSLIMVRVREVTSLSDLLDGISTIDIQ